MIRLLLPFILAAGMQQSTHALETIVDQEHLGASSFGYVLDYPEDYMAQTFTVQNSGTLASVEVQVGFSGYPDYSPVTDDLLLRLVATDSSGSPDISQVLGSYVIPRTHPLLASREVMVPVDLSGFNIQVNRGQVLAIALSSDHTYYDANGERRDDEYQYFWAQRVRNRHPGGDFYLYSPNLFGPEPWHWMDFYDPPDNTRDTGFRVLIEVPEPATSLIAILGLLGMLRTRLCRMPL